MKFLKKLNSYYINLSLQKKLMMLLFILTFTPMIFIGYLSYKNSEDILYAKSVGYSKDIIKMLELRLEDFSNNLKIISKDLILDNRVYGVFKRKSNDNNLLDEYQYNNEVNSYLKQVVLSRNEIQSICLVPKDNSMFYADNNIATESISDNFPYDAILQNARTRRGQAVWYLESKNGIVQNVYLARIVNDRDNFNELGLLVIMIRRSYLNTIYSGLTGKIDNIIIASNGNSLIVSRNFIEPGSEEIKNFEVMKEKRGEFIDKNMNMFCAYRKIPELGWKVGIYVKLDELYQEAYELRWKIIVICIVTLLILTIISTWVAYDLVKPINKLVNAMKSFQKGQEKIFLNEDREDEMGFLSKTFNEMNGEIHYLVNWVYREQITRKDAEIKALQSQINPHFLFNTLESINWMARLNNITEISEMVSELSALMEASIGRGDILISLEEEIDYIDKYMSIIKRRYEDRVDMHKNIEEETLSFKIPRLLLQPLIENAVLHGLESTLERGIIELNSFIKNNTVVIEICDNGEGISEARLAEINQRLSVDNDSYFKSLGSDEKKSIGIENVNRRIKLFYGDDYGLELQSKENEFTKVVVNLPIQQNGGLNV